MDQQKWPPFFSKHALLVQRIFRPQLAKQHWLMRWLAIYVYFIETTSTWKKGWNKFKFLLTALGVTRFDCRAYSIYNRREFDGGQAAYTGCGKIKEIKEFSSNDWPVKVNWLKLPPNSNTGSMSQLVDMQ